MNPKKSCRSALKAGTRRLGLFEALHTYEQAMENTSSQPEKALSMVKNAHELARKVRDEYIRLKQQYQVLWYKENKPYALDRILSMYDASIYRYDKIVNNLSVAAETLNQKGPLPPLGEVGLGLH